MRTLRTAGTLEELTYEMDRYRVAVLGLCEVRWKRFGEITTQEDHNGVVFLVHKDIVNTIMDCRLISSRLFTIRLRAVPINIATIQAYAPTTDYDDDAVEDFYDQTQEVIDTIVVHGYLNKKVGRDAYKNWNGKCGQYCNTESNDIRLRLLEIASYNNLVLANTFGQHKTSRRWTWHSPSGEYHN